MAKVIETKNLSLAFKQREREHVVLEGLNLSVTKGEFIAIVGASGAGKSTLLRVIAKLTTAYKGQVDVFAEQQPNRLPVAMVFQEARLLPWRRVVSNAMLGLESLPLSKEERVARASAALKLVGLGDYQERWPYQLSGGQKQRVGLARALAVDPDLLLMDEPFGALDAITRQNLQDELLRIWQETNKSILFVTHDIDEAVYLADRVILLAGSPAKVAREYAIASARPRQRGGSELANLAVIIRDGLSDSYFYGSDI